MRRGKRALRECRGHSGQAGGNRLERKEAVKVLNGTVEGQLNVPRLYETLARILNEKYDGVKLTVTVRRKDEIPDPAEMEENQPIAV